MKNDGKTLGQTIGEATDRLNVAFEIAENALAALNLGVTAAVPLNEISSLRFAKRSGGWQLIVESPVGESRLLSTSRETRVAAADRLPALYEALVATACAEYANIQTAAEGVEQFALFVRTQERRALGVKD